MNQYKALVVNLGQGSAKEDEEEYRREKLLAFIMKEILAKDHHPDLVLFQEGTSNILLNGLLKVLKKNIPDSDFFLPHPFEPSKKDLIGVFVNEQKIEIMEDYNGKSLEAHRAEALQSLRKENLNFFTEDK